MEKVLFYTTAFSLGAAHALEPGHGKALVTAYLAGARGRLSDALILGGVMALCHTASVMVLALGAAWFLSAFRLHQESLMRSVEVFSGLLILAAGAFMIWRLRSGGCSGQQCHHQHVGQEQATSLRELLLLGMASGLCPSPLPLILLMSTLAIGGLGVLTDAVSYLFIFSLGLASIVTGLGILLIWGRQRSMGWLDHERYAMVPVHVGRFSAGLIMLLGLYLIFNGAWGDSEALHLVSRHGH